MSSALPIVIENALFEPSLELVAGVSLGMAGIAVLAAATLIIAVLFMPRGTKEMIEIAKAIQQGAMAFIFFEYMCLSVFVAIMFIVIAAAINWQSGICYIVGAVASAFTGFVGMAIATQANVRTTAAARTSMLAAMRTAFNGGAVMGLSVVGFGLGGISFFCLVFQHASINNLGYLAGFGLGVTSVSLFSRVGGGIFTKAADVGADLVGKVERGLPEDDARNPATIADNVGDNVGDVAGMGADLCGSFVGSIVASCLLGYPLYGVRGAAYPMWICSTGIVASIIGIMSVWCRHNAGQKEVLIAFRFGLFLTNFSQLGFMAIMTYVLSMPWQYFGVAVIGLAAGFLIAQNSEFFTSPNFPPTRTIANSANVGPANVIIQGLAVGMYACVGPAVVSAAALIGSILLGGVYGAAVASTSMLSCLAFTLATDAFGAIADNAGGIAEMAQLEEHVRQRTDILDAMGNTSAAVGKGFAIGAALLAGFSLVNIFKERVGLASLDAISDPYAVAGLLIGAMIPFFFSAMTMQAVSNGAQAVIFEVRRQLKEMPGILDRTQKPNYARCVIMITASSIHAMIGPAAVTILIPICVGIWFPPSFLGGVLIGNTICGFMLSMMMATSGGAWDNAKKYIESSGAYGGKRSDAHKSAVVGDTVGDPFKDTSGPAINIAIKLANYCGVVLSPIYAGRAGYWWAAFIIFFVSLACLLPIILSSPTNVRRVYNWLKQRKNKSAAATTPMQDDEPTTVVALDVQDQEAQKESEEPRSVLTIDESMKAEMQEVQEMDHVINAPKEDAPKEDAGDD